MSKKVADTILLFEIGRYKRFCSKYGYVVNDYQSLKAYIKLLPVLKNE